MKHKFNKRKIIRRLNWIYFVFSLISIFFLCLVSWVNQSNVYSTVLGWLWIGFLLSRCSEILYAFLIDAYDKVAISKTETHSKPDENKKWHEIELGSSKIKMHHRLVLALRSYLELIINFAIVYSITPKTYWDDCSSPDGIADSLYFSAVTITTLGYGDITPKSGFTEFLSVFEVFCGFTLIVVCFAIYLSRKQN